MGRYALRKTEEEVELSGMAGSSVAVRSTEIIVDRIDGSFVMSFGITVAIKVRTTFVVFGAALASILAESVVPADSQGVVHHLVGIIAFMQPVMTVVIVVGVSPGAIAGKRGEFAIKFERSRAYGLAPFIDAFELGSLERRHDSGLLGLGIRVRLRVHGSLGSVVEHIVEVVAFVFVAKCLGNCLITISLIDAYVEARITLAAFLDADGLKMTEKQGCVAVVLYREKREFLCVEIRVEYQRPIARGDIGLEILAVVVGYIVRIGGVFDIYDASLDTGLYKRFQTADFEDGVNGI